MSNKRISFNAKEMASLLETNATADLKKKIKEELDRPDDWKLTAEELIKLSSVEPLISLESPDPQVLENIERKKEAKLIDKTDANFGVKYGHPPRN